jgi:hypothetical protein
VHVHKKSCSQRKEKESTRVREQEGKVSLSFTPRRKEKEEERISCITTPTKRINAKETDSRNEKAQV